jgi:heme exporter protein C
MRWTWFHRLGSPPFVYGLAQRLTPWLVWSAGISLAVGIFDGLVLSPPDYQQGDG